jgi:SAM-dependent methyltransferase
MIDEKWTSPEYLAGTEEIFRQVDAYLKTPPRRILDIGCGFARVSQLFQQKYGTELWLLDGDFHANPETAVRKAKYGSKESFQFYLSVSDLKQHWDQQGINYRFVDANSIDIPKDIKFDFVCSWISCGFHYPVSSYKTLIQTHTTEDSVVIMDFRRKSLNEQSTDFDIVHNLSGEGGQKKYKLHIKLKD